MNIIPFGDGALLINFEQVINPVINKEVLALCHAIEQSQIRGVKYVTPAYCSLAVGFNPEIISFHDLKKIIQKIETTGARDETNSKHLIIPVCYDEEFALDKKEIVELSGLTWSDVVKFHTTTQYRVYMLGFLPGFVYMGSVPEKISLPRKKVPRLKVQALSVGIAGFQTGIYPTDAPGGWQILGKTPIRIFDSRINQPFLFEPGMTVGFKSVTREEFEMISSQVENQTFQTESLYG